MTVERIGDVDRNVVALREIGDKPWQIALQVNAKCQEVGQHEDLGCARGRELLDGFFQPGAASRNAVS